MTWVIGIEVHHDIGMSSAGHNKSFFIRELRNSTEGALDIVSI
jgi:hypothetical protein